MKLAFLDLPDDRVDLISMARQDPHIEIVLVAHPDPEALALKIAEVLQIPRSVEPLDLLSLKPDQVALPSLASPSAAALVRAGISERIFVTLDEIAKGWANRPRAEANGESAPIDLWEGNFDEALGGRLGRLRDALALSEDRQRLFREILALAVERAGAEAGSLMVVDEEERELRIVFADGLSVDTVRTSRQKLGEGVAGKVALEGKPMIINERLEDPRFRDGRERSRIAAAMSAPIKVQGRTIGVLNVSSDRPGARFAQADLARLVEIADQISEIVERVIRGAKQEVEAIEFRARREIEIAFGRRDLNLMERLRLVAGRLAELFEAEAVQVHIADEANDRFRSIASSGRQGAEGENPMHHGVLARVFTDQQPWFMTARLARPSGIEMREPLPNMVVTPLTGSRPLGVISIECVGRTAADLEEFARLTGRLSGFLARLIEEHDEDSEIDRRSTVLASLADIAARLMVCRDTESMLGEVAGALRALFPQGLLTVRLRGEGGGFVFRSAFDGREPDRQRALEFESILARRAMDAKREITSIGISPEEARRARDESGIGSYALILVRVDDEITGTLGVFRPSGRREGEAGAALSRLDVQTLRKLALFASLATEFARAGAGGGTRATQDPLTGLLASAGFEARIQEEVKRAERYRERFLLTMCVVREYGELKERLGPAWTDAFLREFAVTLSKNVREVDAVARITDGRFAVLSPAADKDSGALLKRLETLLPQLESVRNLPNPGEVRLVGRQYTFPDEVPTGGELLALVRSGA